MTFTYNPDDSFPQNVELANVRLLINDVNPDHPVFQDEEINRFLDIAGNVVLLAAARALETIAADEALTSKVIRSQDIQTDGPKVAESLRALAKSLRDDHAAALDAEDDGLFEIVDHGAGCWPEHSNPVTGGY